MVLKWSRDRDVLLLKRCQLSPATSGFCPDSQNFHSDGAKIQTISETSKFFWGNPMFFQFYSPL